MLEVAAVGQPDEDNSWASFVVAAVDAAVVVAFVAAA